ncbi:MAG: PEP-CTERM sorting domain-containing protein [Planctomycetota bacterium]
MKCLFSCALAALLCFAGSSADATFVTNPNGSITYTGPSMGPGGGGSGMTGWAGTDVWYAGVTESNTQGPGDTTAQLFGAPATVTGNAIDFNPQGFEASVTASSPGFASEIVDSQLSFMVVALPGKVIDNLQFTEAGDTTLAGLPTSTLTKTTVTNEIFIDVLEVDGTPLNAVVNLQGNMTFTPSAGDYTLADDGDGVSPTFATDWSGVADIDIAAGLTAAGFDFIAGATKINVTLDNTLTATAVNGESSFIRKKDFDGLTVTSNIPEPTTLALLAFGVAVAARRRG